MQCVALANAMGDIGKIYLVLFWVLFSWKIAFIAYHTQPTKIESRKLYVPATKCIGQKGLVYLVPSM